MKKGVERRIPAVAAVKACHLPALAAEVGPVAEGAVVAVADLKTKSKGRRVEKVKKEVEESKSQRVER